MMRLFKVILAISVSIACGQPEFPAVAAAATRLDADDAAVIGAVLDELRRTRNRSPLGVSAPDHEPTLPFALYSRTSHVCEALEFDRQRPPCVTPDWLKSLDGLNARARNTFAVRNRTTFEMPNSLDVDVRWIPDRLQTTLNEWLGANRTTVVAVSAPAYFQGAAIVAYHELSQRGGFLQLERDGTGWRVTKESTWFE